jgi:hypothetical protein
MSFFSLKKIFFSLKKDIFLQKKDFAKVHSDEGSIDRFGQTGLNFLQKNTKIIKKFAKVRRDKIELVR